MTMDETTQSAAEQTDSGAISATETVQNNATQASSESDGAISETPQSQEGGSEGEGETQGAIAESTETAEETIDWEKISDDEYMSKVGLPEGQEWNSEAMKEYTKLLKENKIDPKVFAKFVAKDAELQKAAAEKYKAEQANKQKEAQAAFKAAGEEFRKTYSPEQVREINATFSKIDDDTFKNMVAKSPLANNKTMGKMILAYRQVYGEDSVRGAAGRGEGGEKTFEQVWTGK